MASGFRDSFTKEDTKEDVLGYDDTAFSYFAISVLTCVVLPWTISVAQNAWDPGRSNGDQDFPARSRTSGRTFRHPLTAAMVERMDVARREARKCTPRSVMSWTLRLAVIFAIWACIVGTYLQLGDEKEIKQFDPFDILGVTPQASGQVIKRAYRKLSLVYHPDKNPDDPLAAARFISITKAYQALTDEVAKRNWEKYGNPDGPQTTKVGIGLPRFLLEKDHNLSILCAFFFVLLFVIPMTFICYYQQTKSYAANGVMIETLQFLGYSITETTRLKNCPEMVAACAESRGMSMRPTDNAALKPLGPVVHEHKKRAFTLPIVMKNQFLVWAHMQRLHHLMSPEIRGDTDELLGYSMKITQAMIEIACMREWFSTAQAIIEFRRVLVQALDLKSSQLLQVPHFDEKLVEKCAAAKPPVSTLAEFLSLDAERRKGLLEFEGQKLLDVDAFCSHVGDVELKASVEVEDEAEIVVGDVASVTAQILRKNLREEEVMGAVHAPLFPEPKYEEWWFFLVEATATEGKAKSEAPGKTPQTRIVHFERVCETERLVEQKLRFQVTKAGVNNLVLHALCDAYAGLDQKIELSFTAYQEDEFKREFKVNPEDEDLDLQPTLFQQFMGEIHAEESEEEEEEDGEENAPPAGGKRKKKGVAPVPAAEEKKEGQQPSPEAVDAAKADAGEEDVGEGNPEEDESSGSSSESEG